MWRLCWEEPYQGTLRRLQAGGAANLSPACSTRTTRKRARAMPNLPKPRLRRSARRGALVGPDSPAEPQTPNVERIDAAGLRWINIEHPGALERAWLEEHFDFHALDLE